MTELELPPDPARVIEGLRDTGYSFETAIADLIDNSIEAGASRVDVQVTLAVDGQPIVLIADDGCGMTEQELCQAMQYGSPVNQKRRLSKFGLGMKTASTAFCRRLVVTSRGSDGRVSSAVWDLDYIAEKRKWLLQTPTPHAIDLEALESTAGEGTGTVVRWDKIDRLVGPKAASALADGRTKRTQSTLTRKVQELKTHVSSVFNRYLREWDGRPPMEMCVNGDAIAPWDPFCSAEDKTVQVLKKRVAAEKEDGTQSAFDVRSVVIPPKGEYSSNEGMVAARISNENQGIYVYREDRLIHGPDWLRIVRQEPHYSLARVEFSFNQDLDEAFNVDIKKSRIELQESIYDFIKDKVMPPVRKIADDTYRGERKKDARKRADGLHNGSNQILSLKSPELQGSKVESVDEEAQTATLVNSAGRVTISISLIPGEDTSKVFVRPRASLDDGLLWNPTVVDEHVAVDLNTSHPFYERVYLPARSDSVVQAFDYLLWALANAELQVLSEAHRAALMDLRYDASKRLRALALELPELKDQDFESDE
jgi:hypothetical protein